jgi:hypothetical protein
LNTPPPDLDLRWFLPSFVILWLAGCGFLSVLGGWYQLAVRYPATTVSSGRVYSFVSAALGMVSYRSCLFVRFDSAGVSLSIFPLFRFLHRSLRIPWDAIASRARERFWFFPCTVLYVSDPETKLRIFGRAGKDIYAFRTQKA